MMNNELLKNLAINCNHAERTQRNYSNALRKYSEYYGMSLQELLDEAEEDERNNVRWKYSRLKTKLLEYRHHLLETSAWNTVKKDITIIQFFYKFYDIEVGKLPRINQKSVKKSQPIYFKDLPDKEIIREAFKIAPPLMKAIILFSASSGCAKAETLGLTIKDYIDALSEYLPRRKRDIYDIIDYLSDAGDIIPTFRLLRRKTNKYYITYCSPEAVKAINGYLLTREDELTDESPLFKISERRLTYHYQKINDTLNLGRVGNYGRFRSHMMRKFHASALYNDGMSLDKVNDLQGKAKNSTDSVYFMTNPEDLKYEYIKHLPAITINTDVKKLTIKSPEFMQLEKENEVYQNRIHKLESDVASIISRMPEAGK
ncbi:site-specific integrase [Methanobrevibacter sp.]|uniref:site-specific integrase n=1 Tax=Methanobrevibacter sp. TaxID=66852 RepID=UPI00388E919B